MLSFSSLLDRLSSSNVKFKKWSERDKNSNKLIKEIREMLNFISGNDIIEMISSILTKNELDNLNSKYVQCLKNLSCYYHTIKPKQKHHFIRPLREAKISRTEAINLGFHCSKDLWQSCLNPKERISVGRASPDGTLIQSIQDHMENISSIAANRTIKSPIKDNEGKKLDINVFYRNVSFNDAYKSFKDNNQISFSTFYKNIEKKFKPPHRETDLCDWCEYGKEIKKEIIQYLNQNKIESNQNDFNSENMLRIFHDSKKHIEQDGIVKHEQLIEKLKEYKEIEYHKKMSDTQRAAYKCNLLDENLLKDSLLIEIDFKEKIKIGLGPRQLNQEFYQQQQRVLLGFGIYFYENQKINCCNVDIVSNSLSTDAMSVIQSFKYLRNMEFFKRIDKKKYVIWTDCGTHFRCSEFSYYLFKDLYLENIFVKWNFFVEKHGKNTRDQHFSRVSNYLKQESFLNKIKDTADIVNCLNYYQEKSNINRKKLNLEPILYKAINFDLDSSNNLELNSSRKRKSESDYEDSDDDPDYKKTNKKKKLKKFTYCQNTMEIRDISIYYNLQNVLENNNIIIKTSITSNENTLYDLFSSTSLSNKKTIELESETPLPVRPITNVDHLKTKRLKIEMVKNREKIIENANPNLKPMPKWCKIQKCSNCHVKCNYTITDLENSEIVGQIKIKEELFRHKHPQSRILDKNSNKQRTTEQARQELIDHYKKFHFE